MKGFVIRLLARRLALAALTLLGVSLAIFWLVELLPGDAATRSLGQGATPGALAALREQMGLDRPLLPRYWTWLRDFLTGNWGESLAAGQPVSQYLLPRLGNTLMLVGAALLVYLPVSLAVGITTAVFRHRRFATAISAFVLLGTAVPEFVIAIFLLVSFTVLLPLFPPLSDLSTASAPGDVAAAIALPALTLAIAMSAYAIRMVHGSLIGVLESDYVRMATLHGLRRRRVVVRHALPQAVAPMIRVTVINIAWVVGGAVIVERIFAFPGLGSLLIDSVQLLDTPVIAAATLILAGTYIITNMAADILSALFDPKLRG